MYPSTTYMHATATHSAAVKTASAAAEAAASSTAGIGVIMNQADSDENQSRQSGEDATKHGVSSLTDDFASCEAATISARELDVDQRNAAGRAFEKVRQLSSITPGTICTLLPKHLAWNANVSPMTFAFASVRRQPSFLCRVHLVFLRPAERSQEDQRAESGCHVRVLWRRFPAVGAMVRTGRQR
ncbi:hypothetical protein M2227_004949 [Bradyrhizobium elkanii]|uniref:hypothetical protein n=1 Tax=Bradyrhizobium elkanii TaxID=29448 RepID=UPI002227CF5B|nr:hypothetical protein [Bradyrhizobium elkanii]MCW2202859.1 hypothetical protein [Bradyrhizobium elkanii]